MEAKVVAKCIEAAAGDEACVECVLDRRAWAETIAVCRHADGEWLAGSQHCNQLSECVLLTASRVVRALARGSVATYEEEVLAYRVDCERTAYVLKRSGHIVVVDSGWDGLRDYIGRLDEGLEALLRRIRALYGGKLQQRLEEVVRAAMLEAR